MEAVPLRSAAPPPPPVPWRVRPYRSGATLSLLLLIAAIALGVLARYLGPVWAAPLFQPLDLAHLAGLSAVTAALAAAVIAHEAGHLVPALLARFQLLAVTLGPLRFARVSGKWQFRFSLKSLFSGSVSAVPRTTDAWRIRMLLVIAGGPASTFLTGALSALYLLTAPTNHWNTEFLGALFQLSAFIFVLGLIPNSRDARVRNDARLFLILCGDAAESQQILLYHLITQLEVSGVRPRHYPEPLMRQLAEAEGRPDSLLFSANVLTLWALDRGYLFAADAWDRRCLELSADSQPQARNLACASSACFDVLFRNEEAAALRKFDTVNFASLPHSWFAHRALACRYFAQGNIPECLAQIIHARYAAPKDAPYFNFEFALLTTLHKKALNWRPPPLCAAAA